MVYLGTSRFVAHTDATKTLSNSPMQTENCSEQYLSILIYDRLNEFSWQAEGNNAKHLCWSNSLQLVAAYRRATDVVRAVEPGESGCSDCRRWLERLAGAVPVTPQLTPPRRPKTAHAPDSSASVKRLCAEEEPIHSRGSFDSSQSSSNEHYEDCFIAAFSMVKTLNVSMQKQGLSQSFSPALCYKINTTWPQGTPLFTAENKG